MKRILFITALISSLTVASAQQTKPAKKEDNKKECCVKKDKSCCSPSSKAKAILKAKPTNQNKK